MATVDVSSIRALTPGYVMLMRHRAINLREASGKARLECYELLHHMLEPDQVLELIDAWLRMRELPITMRERRPGRRRAVLTSAG